jgi:hypothetical protein
MISLDYFERTMNRRRPNTKRIANLGPVMNLWNRKKGKNENLEIESNVLNEWCKPID